MTKDNNTKILADFIFEVAPKMVELVVALKTFFLSLSHEQAEALDRILSPKQRTQIANIGEMTMMIYETVMRAEKDYSPSEKTLS